MIGGSVFAFLFAFFFTAPLTNTFYQPSKQIYSNPSKANKDFEDIKILSQDGTHLHGWFFPAQTQKSRVPKGTIVQFHGNAQNITTHFLSLEWVTQAGYHFFTFDYRGYGKSSGTPTPHGVHQDALAAIAWIQQKIKQSHPQADIILYGQSLGGAILLRAIEDLKFRSRIRTVIVESSFSSYVAMAQDVMSRNWLTFALQPLAFLLISDRYAPTDTISNISPIPLLVIHGDQDKIVPLKFGEDIFERARHPKHFWLIKGGRHIDAMHRENGAYRTRLIEFLNNISVP